MVASLERSQLAARFHEARTDPITLYSSCVIEERLFRAHYAIDLVPNRRSRSGGKAEGDQ